MSSLKIPNPFGAFFEKLVSSIIKYPNLSTWFAAIFLSFIWTISWLLVFFLSTWIFELNTKAHDFITVFWLSIAAESVIRWAENTNLIAQLSKPYLKHPSGDNEDFKWMKASTLLFSAITIMFFLDHLMESTALKKSGLTFIGLGKDVGMEQLYNMVASWYHIFFDGNIVTLILLGTFFRAMIYKRRSTKPTRD